MNKSLAILLIIVCPALASAQMSSSIGVLVSPLNKKATPAMFYQLHLMDGKRSIRTMADLTINTRKEVRDGEITTNAGKIAYSLAIGMQNNWEVSSQLQMYCGMDGYWNSAFRKPNGQEYYGYFYNFGFRPLLGAQWSLYPKLNVVLEGRADFNINTQAYTGEGDGLNYDRKYRFNMFDHLAVGLTFDLD